MKKSIFLIVAAFVISSIVFISCNKDMNTIQSPAPDELASQQFLDDVNWFLNAAKIAKTGNNTKAVSGEKITLDSALYYFDATLNYKYGFASARFKDQKIDTVLVRIRLVPGEKKVYVTDAALAYNQAVDKLRLKYNAIDESVKELQGCIFENAGKTSGNDSIIVRVIGIFGTGAPIQPNINEYGYWWYRNSYNCDMTVMGYGAPEYLESKLLEILSPPPPRYFRVVITNVIQDYYTFMDPKLYRTPDDSLDNYCDYKIFHIAERVSPYSPELLCLGICLDKNTASQYTCEMNFYLGSMTELFEQFLQDHGNKSLLRIHIESVNICIPKDGILEHRVSFHYGDRKLIDLRREEQMDYPLTIACTD